MTYASPSTACLASIRRCRVDVNGGLQMLLVIRVAIALVIVAYAIMRVRRVVRESKPDDRDLVAHEILTVFLGLLFVIAAYVWMVGIDARWSPERLGRWRQITLGFAGITALSGFVLGWRRSSRRRM